jgi:hypothetical protein
MFERRARGEGITALCRFLEQRGVITPYGNAGWVTNSLRGVIANRAYSVRRITGRSSTLQRIRP